MLYLHSVDRLESGRFPSSVHFGGATHREVGEQGLGWGSKGGGGGSVCANPNVLRKEDTVLVKYLCNHQ